MSLNSDPGPFYSQDSSLVNKQTQLPYCDPLREEYGKVTPYTLCGALRPSGPFVSEFEFIFTPLKVCLRPFVR